MEFFKVNTKIDFMGLSLPAAIFSGILFLASTVSLIVNHLNLGLDFTGGTQMELSFDHPADVNKIRQELSQANFKEAEVQMFGDSRNVQITVPMNKQDKNIDEKTAQEKIKKMVMEAVPDAKINDINFIGAKVSSELAYKGVLAVIVAILITMIYIAMRFEYRLAIGSAVGLIHDPILILGIFSFFRVQFDLTSLAAVLTIIGYSLNDTIVIFDRIRENFRKIRKGTPKEIVNASINETLSRTLMSSAMTLLVVTTLFILGGASIHEFALVLIIGIIIGTYSSIYVSGSLAVALGLSRTDLLVTAKKEIDDRP